MDVVQQTAGFVFTFPITVDTYTFLLTLCKDKSSFRLYDGADLNIVLACET